MPNRRSRLVAPLLALSLLAVTGCGRPVAGAPAPGRAPAGFAALGIGDPVASEARLYDGLFRDMDRDGDGMLSRAEVRGSWLEAELAAMDADGDGKLTRFEAERFFSARAPRADRQGKEGLGLVGAIGLGAIGLGLAGYLTYTGIRGSNDLMHPKKETLVKPPSAYGLPFERFVFESHDGLHLVGWYVPARVPTDKAIVMFHGHGSNKDVLFEKYGPWLADEFNLFVYDQRYSGESEGETSSLGPYEVRDALEAIEQVKLRGNHAIGFFGESMGAAVAVAAGAQLPEVKAVWSDCAYASQYDAIAPRAIARGYPLPGPVAHSVIKTAGLRLGTDLTAVDPVRWAAKIAPRPFYLVHGAEDDETTPMNGEKLFAAAREPKQAWWVQGAKHANSYKVQPEQYRSRLRAFFDAALGATP